MAGTAVKRALLRPVALLRLTSDRQSYREFMRLRSQDEHASAGEKEVELRIGRLNGRPVWLREGTTDVDTLWDVFIHSYHLPPARVQRRGMHLVWDLGANIGLTMAEMALRWPEARVVGVEPDSANAALARRNFEPWDDRAELIESSVAPDAGAPGLSLNGLLERTGGPVAFVKMDIGGAEREVLRRNTEWASQVGCIKVEVHDGYAPEDCVRDLEQLGFEARRDRRHDSAVVGVR
jgi:hypothetical protein